MTCRKNSKTNFIYCHNCHSKKSEKKVSLKSKESRLRIPVAKVQQESQPCQ